MLKFAKIKWTSRHGAEENRFPAYSKQDAEDTLREYMNRGVRDGKPDVVVSVESVTFE